MKWDDLSKKVKNTFSWDNGDLYRGKSRISNYYIKAVGKLKGSDGRSNFVKVQLIVGEEEQIIDEVIDISKPLDISCIPDRYLECIHYKRTAKDDLIILLKMQIQDVDVQGRYIDKLGWHKLDNTWIYCAGQSIVPVSDDSSIIISKKISDEFFIQRTYQSRRDIANLLIQLIEMPCPAPKICLIYLIISLSRSLFEAANMLPKFVVYICGKTATYKTTIARYFFDIYSKNDETLFAGCDLTSSQPAIRSIAEKFRDCIFTIDDLSLSTTSSEKIQKEQTINDIIRSTANAQPKYTKSGNDIEGNNYDCLFAVTAEYPLKNESILNRTVFVDLDRYPINEEFLKFMTDNPRFSQSLSLLFIEWLSENTQDYIDSFAGYKRRHFNNDSYKFSPRINNSYAMLRLGLNLFITFFKTLKNIDSAEVYQKINKEILTIFENEENIIKRIRNDRGNYNIATEIVKLIDNKQLFCGVRSEMDAKKEYALLENKYVFIKPKVLLKQLQLATNDTSLTSEIELGKRLKKAGLLALDNSKTGNTVKRDTGRHYRILRDRLLDLSDVESEVINEYL